MSKSGSMGNRARPFFFQRTLGLKQIHHCFCGFWCHRSLLGGFCTHVWKEKLTHKKFFIFQIDIFITVDQRKVAEFYIFWSVMSKIIFIGVWNSQKYPISICWMKHFLRVKLSFQTVVFCQKEVLIFLDLILLQWHANQLFDRLAHSAVDMCTKGSNFTIFLSLFWFYLESKVPTPNMAPQGINFLLPAKNFLVIILL